MQQTTDKIYSPFDDNLEAKKIIDIDVEYIKKGYNAIKIPVDTYFENMDVISIYECPKTKYRFYYPYSVIGDSKFYEALQSKKTDYYPPHKGEFDVAYNLIEPNSTLLEIGCGDGAFLERIKSKNVDAVGLEFNDLAIQKCSNKGLRVEKKSIDEYAIHNESKFDNVVFFQVLEHIKDVQSFLQASIKVLKKNGKLIIAVPDNSPYYKNFRIHETMNLPPHHMGLWNAQSFKNLEKVFAIKNIGIDYVGNPNYLSYVYFHAYLKLLQAGVLKFKYLFMPFLLPFSAIKVLSMKLSKKLFPDCIVATFVKL